MSSLDIEHVETVVESQVKELLDQPGGEATLYHRLHGIFISEGPDLIGELRRLLPEGERSEIHDMFHNIKGSSAAMGAKRINELAAYAVQVCREDGQIAVPHEDIRCPTQDCQPLNYVELVSEGLEQTCLEHRFDQAVHACAPSGHCGHSATVDVCERTSTRVVARAYGPCTFIEGCEGDGHVALRWAADGTECPGGSCITGQCVPARKQAPVPVVPTVRCNMFPGKPFCKEGLITPHLTFCEFRVETPDYRTCAEICEMHGARCLRGWDDARNSCERHDSYGCHVRELDQICRCEMPATETGMMTSRKLPIP